MSVSKLKKSLEVRLSKKTMNLYENGVKCKTIGSGGFRKAFVTKDGYVVKVGHGANNDDQEAIYEYDEYKRLRKWKKVKPHIARFYKPIEVNVKNDKPTTVSVMDHVKGETLLKAQSVGKICHDDRQISKVDTLCWEHDIMDMHENNMILCNKTKKLKIIDLGYS